MQSAQNPGYEHAIMLFYVHHIVVALPLTILIIKIVVRFVTREPAKDIFRSVLVLPLDLVYVAFGLLLAGMSRRIPAFVTHYQTDKEADFGESFYALFCLWLRVSSLGSIDSYACCGRNSMLRGTLASMCTPMETRWSCRRRQSQ